MNDAQPTKLFWQPWSVPKEGNTIEQNEDACRAEEMLAGEESLLIAIADGASETVYSRLWAYALVKAADTSWTALSDEDLNERLTQVRTSFSPIPPDAQIPWYVRNKFLAQGSQATLLVTTIERSKESAEFIVRSVAVGDCCLLHFSAGGEVNSFPMRSTADFSLNPVLVMNRNQSPLEFPRSEMRLRYGDFLLVCTDATGKWALQCMESNQAALIFDVLIGLLSYEFDQNPDGSDRAESPPIADVVEKPEAFFYSPLDYAQFISQSRSGASQPRMRNDDATLVLCLPVLNDRDMQAEALAIIGRHRASAARSPTLALNSSR